MADEHLTNGDVTNGDVTNGLGLAHVDVGGAA
jgi:hypothetical protein